MKLNTKKEGKIQLQTLYPMIFLSFDLENSDYYDDHIDWKTNRAPVPITQKPN